MTEEKPGLTLLEDVKRGAQNPFATLVGRAPFDAEALEALAMAYEALPVAGRRPLIDAIITDAATEKVSPAPSLVAVLSVEPDVELAGFIAERLAEVDAADLRVSRQGRSVVRGTVQEGLAFLLEPLYGDFVEVVELHWRDGEFCEATHEPLLHVSDAEERMRSLGRDELSQGVEHGLETLARVIWANRRQSKELPCGLKRFAHLFSAPPSSMAPGSEPTGL